MQRLVFMFLASGMIAGTVFADIAPTQYSNSGITPMSASGIRMKNARVDIEWGSLCTLTGVFEMDNETSKPVDVQLGFPLVSLTMPENGKSIDYSIAFDGVPVPPEAITRAEKSKSTDFWGPWHACRHIFKPGITTVTVKTQLPASFGIWPYRESLAYIIETGRFWKGTIGREEVNIKFPARVFPDQVFTISPKSFTIKGDTVKWVFQNIKPKGPEYDIHLTYLRPDACAVLAARREALAKEPENADRILALAKSLFELGIWRGYEGYLEPLTGKDYEAVLAKTKNKEDLATLKLWFAPRKDGSYEVNSFDVLPPEKYRAVLASIDNKEVREKFKSRRYVQSDNTYAESANDEIEERHVLMRILSDAGYEPSYARSPHVVEARAILEQLLKKRPHNVAAWNMYLANYHRFKFILWDSSDPGHMFKDQSNVIAEAHRDCPDDPLISLWYRYSTDLWNDPDTLKKIGDAIEKESLSETDYPQIKYDYY